MQNGFSRDLALDSSLASTRMEGFEITELTRHNCPRLWMAGSLLLSWRVRSPHANRRMPSNVAYSIDPISANCYPGTTILINKFDIRDELTPSEAD